MTTLEQMAADLADETQYTLDELIAHGEHEDASLKAQEKVVDLYKAEIKTRLETMGFQAGQSVLPEALEGRGVLYSVRTTPKAIDRELLVMENVDPAVIDRCTVGGVPGKPFVQFVRPRVKGEKSEAHHG